jgi:hypothetical protein
MNDIINLANLLCPLPMVNNFRSNELCNICLFNGLFVTGDLRKYTFSKGQVENNQDLFQRSTDWLAGLAFSRDNVSHSERD